MICINLIRPDIVKKHRYDCDKTLRTKSHRAARQAYILLIKIICNFKYANFIHISTFLVINQLLQMSDM